MKAADLQIRAAHIGAPQKIRQPQNTPKNPAQVAGPRVDFGDMLKKQVDQDRQVQFSAHAAKRLQDRSLELTPDRLERLNEGVKQADAKGAVNSLVLVDDTAFVVSVRNNTVITALDKSGTTGKVFTNIDSVAIM